MKLALFAILMAHSQLSLACPKGGSLSAQVVDQDCKNFGDWKSDPYQKLQAKLTAQADARCRKNGMSATIDYVYESIVCEDSILSAEANFHCWW